MSNYVTHDNIFDRCLGYLVTHAGDVAVYENNTYIQHYGENFARLSGKVYTFDGNAKDVLATVGETSPTLWYIMEPRGGSEK
jgi:hypothetical protein